MFNPMSKCHGAFVYWMKHWKRQFPRDVHDYVLVSYCSKCHKPCETEEKKETDIPEALHNISKRELERLSKVAPKTSCIHTWAKPIDMQYTGGAIIYHCTCCTAQVELEYEYWDEEEIRVDLQNICMDRTEGMYFPAYYKKRLVAYMYCSGAVELTGKKDWKEDWEFKIEFDKCGCVKVLKKRV